MAQTPAAFRQTGVTLDYTPGTAKTAGDVVAQGKLIGVCKHDIAANVKGELCVSGVFDMPKDNSNISAVGAAVYWDVDGSPVGGTALSGAVSTTATGNVFLGWALAIAGVGVGMVEVLVRSANDTTALATDELSDVGTVDHTAGDILIADGTKFEGLPLTGPFNLSAAGLLSVDSATVAATGTVQADAAAIADGFTLVTAADAAKGVKLPAAAAGKLAIVKNADAANAVLKIWPNTDDAINAIAANSALSIAAKTSVILVAYDATTWYTIPLLPS